jgi:hypothetical protein
MKKNTYIFFTADCDAFVVQSGVKSAVFTQYLADNHLLYHQPMRVLEITLVRTQWFNAMGRNKETLRKTNPCMLILGLQIDRVWGFQ